MVLGTVVTPATVVNAGTGDADTEQEAKETTDTKTNDATDKDADKGTVTINYFDENGLNVGSTTVSGDYEKEVAVPVPDNGYTLNDSKATVKIPKKGGKAEVYSISVSKSISNNLIFKTSDGDEIAHTTITGTKIGENIDLAAALTKALADGKVSDNYAVDDSAKTLQSEDNTQIVTVKKTSGTQTPFKGVVTTNPNVNFVQLYTVGGAKGVRGLAGGTSWKTATKMVLGGVTYYQVSTEEWLKQSDVTVKDESGNVVSGSDNNTSTDNSGVQKADRSTVTTIDGNIIFLYTKDGDLITTRGLGGNSSWRTDQMITVKGEKMYRVATNEWLKVSEIK